MHIASDTLPGPAAAGETACFAFPLRVYYEDTDAVGVVYYANYLKYCERARTEWLRALGFEQRRVRTELGLVFVVRAVKAAYRRPALLDDALVVESRIARLGPASLAFAQTVRRETDPAPLFEAEIEIASVDAARLRPAPIPPHVREKFASLVTPR